MNITLDSIAVGGEDLNDVGGNYSGKPKSLIIFYLIMDLNRFNCAKSCAGFAHHRKRVYYWNRLCTQEKVKFSHYENS